MFYPCNEEVVLNATKHIRSYVAQTTIRVKKTDPLDINVTINLDTSSLKSGSEITAEVLLARADQVLYRSKHNGRNCIHSEN